MRVTQTSKQTVSYLDHVTRFQGFMDETRLQEIYTKELPVNADSYAVVDLNVKSTINGIDAIVTYKQKIVKEEGRSNPITLFQYRYNKDLATTQQMMEQYAVGANISSNHVEGLREIIPGLMLKDMVDNNVYGLTAEDWTTEVID